MNDEYYMSIALAEALKAEEHDDVPIGAIIVKDDQVIARAHNNREREKRVIAHAEILAIDEANKKLGMWHLDDCTMYVTLEPCMMCSGAIIQSRMKRVVIGATDSRWPGLLTFIRDHKFNHEVQVDLSQSREICSKIISAYFKKKRTKVIK